MLRRLLTFLSLVSLLLCVAICVLWVRSYQRAPADVDHYSWISGGAASRRFTLWSDPGELRFTAPPPWNVTARCSHGARTDAEVRQFINSGPLTQVRWDASRASPAAELPTFDQVLNALHNDQIRWVDRLTGYYARLGPVPMYFIATGDGTAAHLLGVQRYNVDSDSGSGPTVQAEDPPIVPDADLIPGLLSALEDPNRFAAAHFLLADRLAGRVPVKSLEWSRHANGLARVVGDGLAVELKSPVSGGPKYERMRTDYARAFEAQIVPGQLPAIRMEWHRRLDAELWKAKHWQVAAITALFPLLWLGAVVASSRRRRRLQGTNLCAKCGYDLRASPDRCPECGALPEAVASKSV